MIHRGEGLRKSFPIVVSAISSESGSRLFKPPHTGDIPDGACDCHVHVFEPERFPYVPDRTYTPGTASAETLDQFRKELGISRTVLVQPSVYGNDNRCLVNGLAVLGPDVARGVAVIDPEVTSDQEIHDLYAAGVRGVRVNLETKGERSSASALKAIGDVAQRAAGFGLAVQAYIDLALIEDIADTLAHMPVPLILDHFAGAKAARGVEQPGFRALTQLLNTGGVWVKLSGIYRASQAGPAFNDMRPIAEALIEANPDRLVWASDWPHTGSIAARKARAATEVEPFQQIDDSYILGLVAEWTQDPALLRRILVENAAQLFDFT